MKEKQTGTKTCPMCGRPGRWLRDVCSQCWVWWGYHFSIKRHGPGYFVNYIALKQRALQRATFATGGGGRVILTRQKRKLRAV